MGGAGELSPKRLADLKRYMQVTHDEDDALITMLHEAGASYLAGAGITYPCESQLRMAQLELLLNYLVLDAYDRRVSTITGTIVAANPGFERLLRQLKFTDERMCL